jgi:hypothetical protein
MTSAFLFAMHATSPRGWPMHEIFMTYRRADSQYIADRIYERLAERFKTQSVFKDVDNILPGTDFTKVLQDAVDGCRVMLVVIGDRWLDAMDESSSRRLDREDDYVRREIEAGLARHVPLIPLLVGGASMPRTSDLPESLAALTRHQGMAIRPDPDFHHDMSRLIAAVKPLVRARPVQQAAVLPAPAARRTPRWWIVPAFSLLVFAASTGAIVARYILPPGAPSNVKPSPPANYPPADAKHPAPPLDSQQKECTLTVVNETDLALRFWRYIPDIPEGIPIDPAKRKKSPPGNWRALSLGSGESPKFLEIGGWGFVTLERVDDNRQAISFVPPILRRLRPVDSEQSFTTFERGWTYFRHGCAITIHVTASYFENPQDARAFVITYSGDCPDK